MMCVPSVKTAKAISGIAPYFSTNNSEMGFECVHNPVEGDSRRAFLDRYPHACSNSFTL